MLDPKKLKYLKSHEWLDLNGDAGTVGISDHAQKEITDVVFIEPPKVGRTVKQGEACCVVESVKAAFDIYAPVSARSLRSMQMQSRIPRSSTPRPSARAGCSSSRRPRPPRRRS